MLLLAARAVARLHVAAIQWCSVTVHSWGLDISVAVKGGACGSTGSVTGLLAVKFRPKSSDHALRPQLVCECTVPYHPETGGGRDATTRDRAALRTDLYTLELERVDTQ